MVIDVYEDFLQSFRLISLETPRMMKWNRYVEDGFDPGAEFSDLWAK